jgi:REP element-mobilizing transposase RayT
VRPRTRAAIVDAVSPHVPRLEVPYGFFHIGTRGNNRRSIFADDRDRESFLVIMRRVARRYAWQLYAYCLMNNHYHLIVQIADLGLSQGMCELNTAHLRHTTFVTNAQTTSSVDATGAS